MKKTKLIKRVDEGWSMSNTKQERQKNKKMIIVIKTIEKIEIKYVKKN